MTPGITFALLSLVFSGANDFVFKKYSSKDRSRGMYVLGIGTVWTLLQISTFAVKGIPISFDGVTVAFGLAAGIVLLLSNILFIESLTHLDVSLGSTIYRLNTIGVVILSFLLLSEPLNTPKTAGILLGIAGVLFLYRKQQNSSHNSTFILFFLIAIIASFFRAAYGVTTKAGILQNADPDSMLLLISSSWIVGGACYALLKEKRLRITGKKAAYSIVSGLLVFLIANFLMLAVEYGEASVVIPIANMGFTIALALSITMKMEMLTARKLCAIGCAIASIILLSQA